MMKKSLIAASILLMASFVSFAQDSNERYYNYEILTPQRNNSRTAPKPKVEGWAAERVTEKLDRGVVAVKSSAGGSLKAQRSAALSPHFAVAREDPELSCNSPATSESANTSDIKVLTFRGVPGGINLPPPGTDIGANTLIINNALWKVICTRRHRTDACVRRVKSIREVRSLKNISIFASDK